MQPGTPPAQLQLGLIGTGRIGRVHAEHLSRRLPGVKLVMVSDVNEASARECAAQFQVPEANGDFRRLLERPDIHAVVICSSTDTHAEIIEAAAGAGKHVFCEKPIDFDLRRIDHALGAVERAGVLLQVGFNRRFDANFRRIREAVASGAIGVPHQLHIISRDPSPPPIDYVRKSGGLFMDMAIHDFDMARFLLNDEVAEIYATGGVRVNPAIGEAGDIDTAVVLLKFASGATGIIENSRQALYGYDQRAEVFGSGGAIRVDNNYPNTAILSGADRIHRDLPLNFFMDRYLDSYLAEMKAFIEAVRNGGPSPVSGAAGRAPVVMAKAARRSWQENRPIKLAEITE